MAVRYNEEVAYARPFRFLKLLFRWRGSFYKLIVYEFAIYFTFYLFLNVLHSFILNDEQDLWFTSFCAELGRMSGYVVGSVTFCLGFFIQKVYKRYCDQFNIVPFPDSFAFLVSVNVRGEDTRGRLLRRTMVRYGVASIILTWMTFSDRMRVLFPDLNSLVLGGFLTQNEVNILSSVPKASGRQLVVASWAAAVVKRARLESRIEDDFAYNSLINALDDIRMKCRRLMHQNDMPVPLAYLHTVVISVYSFFCIAAVSGSHRLQTQRLHKDVMMNAEPGDKWLVLLLCELVTLLHFSICAGVLAISRSLMAPFGMDDDNIDVEDIVRRHLSQAYLIVDELHALIPEIADASSNENEEKLSIFQDSEGDFWKRRGSSRAASIDEGQSSSAKPAKLILSFAPTKKDDPTTTIRHHHHVTSPVEAARNQFLQKRSQSKLERLLIFRKLN